MTGACDACLRRGYLIGLLAGRIAGLLDRPDRRRAGLLALDDAELAMAVGGRHGDEALEFLAHFAPRRARADLTRSEVATVCRHADGYPAQLRDLGDPPAVLFCRGRTQLLASIGEEPAVTVVGTRDATPYGVEVAHDLGRGLAAAGIAVVSGMALGVDGAAHRGALGARGATVAVLAGGPDVVYPRRHLDLHREISASGVVVSELPPGQRPYRWSFPARNRIMAALARVVVVVEAGEGSGTLITADFATDLGRTVAVVPGRVTTAVAQGSNGLLRSGASLVRNAGDVLDELFGVGEGPRVPTQEPVLDPLDRRLLDAVEAGLDLGRLSSYAGIPVEEARVALTRLEIEGLVHRDLLGGWERRR